VHIRLPGRRALLSVLLTVPVVALAACSSKPAATGTGSSSTPTPAAGASDADFGAACSSVPSSGAGSFAGMTQDPVATAASNNPVLSALVSAVTAAGLGDTLNNASGLTVFAPANSAFAQIPTATMSSLLADPTGELTTILKYHVISGRLSPDQLVGQHTTLEGGTLTVTGSRTNFMVNGSANVVCGNVQTANATVYIIDSVLQPFSTDFGPSCSSVPASGAGSFTGMTADPVATAASNNPVLSTLVTAVTKAGLGDTLNSAPALTVFAPDNSAFAKIPAATLNSLLADPTGELTTILKYHVISGKLSPDQLDGTHTTLEGGTLSVSGGAVLGFTVNGSTSSPGEVVCGNVQTANATVYIVDSVLQPPTTPAASPGTTN